MSSFVFVLFCLIAGHYLRSGVRELLNWWGQVGQIHYLQPNAYANGWLSWVRPETIDRLTDLDRTSLRFFCLVFGHGAWSSASPLAVRCRNGDFANGWFTTPKVHGVRSPDRCLVILASPGDVKLDG